ncbi:MAG: DUF4870 domain-containing protein [Pyrinomonadaceae bacterium]|nr:DUF4870 domain-containing protein [Pyrinomonadaceae bacterium]MCX7640321.1 DUF4870 domain-containing protein [Pyrinomonadaceae bacterium]MDW8304748.1 DUF4870 domain-containing protein [Acidobacteriota bacterium]
MQNTGKTSLGLETNVASLLCYLPVCCFNIIYSIIVLVTEKANKVVRFHALQAIILAAVFLIVSFLLSALSVFFGRLLGALASMFGLLNYLLAAGYLVISVLCCVWAYQGRDFKLPVISELAEKYS